MNVELPVVPIDAHCPVAIVIDLSSFGASERFIDRWWKVEIGIELTHVMVARRGHTLATTVAAAPASVTAITTNTIAARAAFQRWVS